MNKLFVLIILLLLFFPLSCSKRDNLIESIETGSELSKSGYIKNSSLGYTFPEFKKNGEVKDLFNYIYFKGDTICFSIKADIIMNSENTSVFFINTKDGNKYKAERLDFHKNMVSGFSLVGSVMEQFYSANLLETIPEKFYCCEEIPFEILVVLKNNNKIFELRKKSAFIIKYN